MLSYQHGYHSGNFADVIKHVTLTRLLNYLTQKDKPLFYLETHAGRGMYDLEYKQALKTGESENGIKLLWKTRKQLPSVFNSYIESIQRLNEGDKLRFYPGSPALAIDGLRSIDRLFCSELHSREFDHLEQLPKQNKRVLYSNTNGLDQLKALLPPPERRGLIFIDPSFEIKTDYKHIPALIKQAHQRFATGVYCLWYPLVDKKLTEQLERGMKAIGADSQLRIEFNASPPYKGGMTGCGLWILNPPFVLREEIKIALESLRKLINPGVSSYILE